ncbi:hypothetical protein [Agromyces subbeticus]|uniref:hypothetical protein n=1 Tax=Agromyces subbeticus TaxID=293890 RepID=UPI0012EC2F0F|nr:hypothetical protein [Agromyces subbeticus]
MSMFPIIFDPDRWVRVPTDWADEQWSDAAEWAEWVADELTHDRASAAAYVGALRDQATAIATFPNEHVSARFWFFPIDGDPSGWVDVFVQRRDIDGADAASLLPPVGVTLIEPAVLELEDVAFESAVRRLTLSPIDEQPGEVPPGILAKGEWSAVTGEWAVYLVSIDGDPRVLTRRLADIDRLLGGIEPAVLAALPEASA